MNAIAAPLIPILLLILLGYGLRRAAFMPDAAWAGLERLAYFVLFPALLVRNLASQDIHGYPWQAMLTVIVGTSLIAAAVLVAWHLLRRSVDGDTFTSIFQGGVRFNSYIALAVSQAFFGAEGLAAAAIVCGFLIILVNLLSLSTFSIWGSNGSSGPRAFMRDVAYNPLILACAAGWLLSATGIGLPGLTSDILELVSQAALPVGLLAVGAALRPHAIRGHLRPVAISSVVQFALKPLVVAALVAATGLTGVAAGVLYVTFVTPVASSSYVLARQLGGEASVMASIITLQTALAFVAMPLVALIVLGRI
jgi:predicted permease